MTERNRAWIPVIEAAAPKGPVVAAFGALHLSGTDGVLALARARGFTLERLDLRSPQTCRRGLTRVTIPPTAPIRRANLPCPKVHSMIKVFGHKSPDTDSTGSPIIWAWYLTEVQGTPAEPRLLGEPNTEAAFVLKHWGLAEARDHRRCRPPAIRW